MFYLDNKGFAITGILYSVFIVFLLIMVSVLGVLQSKRAMLDRSFVFSEDFYEGTIINGEVQRVIDSGRATVDGKYVFNFIDTKDNNKSLTICSTYLHKGDALDHNVVFVPDDCNHYTYDYSTDGGSAPYRMELIEVYSFERE